MEEKDIYGELPPEDSAEELEIERKRVRREGKLEDTAAIQAIICLLAAISLVLFNLRSPDRAEEIFLRVKTISADETELFGNPIYPIEKVVQELCRK